MNAIVLVMSAQWKMRAQRRWVVGAAVGLAVVSAALMFASTGIAAQAGFGPTAGALVNVDMLIVPLLATVLGALSIVRDRERGALAYLCAQPIAIGQLFWAKWFALMVQLAAIVCGAFAVLFAALSLARIPNDALAMLQFMGATALLAFALGSVGMLVSVITKRTPAALACAIAVWLFFVVFADVGVMAGALATHLQTGGLLAVTLANPVEAYKIAAIGALSGSIDVLGPGGQLATDTFGAFVMPVCMGVVALWAAAAAAAARRLLEHNVDA